MIPAMDTLATPASIASLIARNLVPAVGGGTSERGGRGRTAAPRPEGRVVARPSEARQFGITIHDGGAEGE